MATRKTPQDHKQSDEARQIEFTEVEGHELLIPFSKVKGSDQARLVAQLDKMNTDGELESEDLAILADVIDYISEKFAVDSAKFDEFTCGRGGMERALNLAMAYASELGKDAA